MNHATTRAVYGPQVSTIVRRALLQADRAAAECSRHGTRALLEPDRERARFHKAESAVWERIMVRFIRTAEMMCRTDADRAALNACLGLSS